MDSSRISVDRQIPTGTVTFLFTDIESSTAMAQEFPVEMNSLLDLHNALLRQAIEAHHGVVFRITGDAFACAFHTVGDAVLAALDAQRSLLQQAWRPTPIKVRMGIHTGAAQAGAHMDLGDGYEGYLTLTRVQRVMSAAHGGQVLLSGASAELLRGQLPDAVILRDMGEHRLKGLVNPERLWQLVAPDLPSEFPPLLSFNSVPSNLPAQPTALIGREMETAEIVKRLRSVDARLVTLTGPGGIGKTRMALQAAAELVEQFRDGVFFVDLAFIKDPESVPTAIAQTIGLKETSDQPVDEIKRQLHDKSILLLLDNFEQVMSAAPKVVELLRDCPQLKFLVTSREALHLRGEYVYPVPPLALPRIDLKKPAPEQLTQYVAVQLFIERAQSVKPDFNVTNENAPAVAEICWRLDGLPLAIELAAARIRLFSPQALLERLGSRLKLLRGGARDMPLRQQTLHDAIDWSYEMLDSGEKRLFELLSVFSGGCSFEAVEAVAGEIESLDEMGVDIVDGLTSLVDKSLVRRVDLDTGETRLQMLETIREFAAEKLEAGPEFQAAARQAHASYYASFTQDQWQRLTGDGREAASADLVADIDNVRTAWEYWVDVKDLEQLNKFVDSLWLLYDARGWYRSTIDLSTDMLDVLSSAPSTPERIQQEILLQTGLARALQVIKGFTPEVEQAYTRAVKLSEEVGEIPELFPALRGLGSLYSYIGQFEKAGELAAKILSMAERLNDPDMQVEGHLRVGYSLALSGKVHAGLDHLDKAIALYDPERYSASRFQLGNNSGVIGLNVSALFLWMVGFPERALERANKAVDLARRLNHPYSLAYALFHTGLLHFWRREAERAQECSRVVVDIAGEHEFQVWEAVATCLQGAALARSGQAEQGLAQIRRGIDLYQGLKTPPVFWPLLNFMQAEASWMAGKPEQGLAVFENMQEFVPADSKDLLAIEFYRLRGDLLLAQSPHNSSEAELLYLRALEASREQSALMLRLRAATGLARLWHDQGKTEQARQLLGGVIMQFTEGFATADLKEARALLEDLA